jgi:hypothetical protein
VGHVHVALRTPCHLVVAVGGAVVVDVAIVGVYIDSHVVVVVSVGVVVGLVALLVVIVVVGFVDGSLVVVIVVHVVLLAIDRVVVAVGVSMLVDYPVDHVAQCGLAPVQLDVPTLDTVRGVENGLCVKQNGA